MQELDLDMLLMSIHDYFMGLGVDEIRRRGADDDKPLRMVKTILHELCKLKVSQHLQTSPQVFVLLLTGPNRLVNQHLLDKIICNLYFAQAIHIFCQKPAECMQNAWHPTGTLRSKAMSIVCLTIACESAGAGHKAAHARHPSEL